MYHGAHVVDLKVYYGLSKLNYHQWHYRSVTYATGLLFIRQLSYSVRTWSRPFQFADINVLYSGYEATVVAKIVKLIATKYLYF